MLDMLLLLCIDKEVGQRCSSTLPRDQSNRD